MRLRLEALGICVVALCGILSALYHVTAGLVDDAIERREDTRAEQQAMRVRRAIGCDVDQFADAAQARVRSGDAARLLAVAETDLRAARSLAVGLVEPGVDLILGTDDRDSVVFAAERDDAAIVPLTGARHDRLAQAAAWLSRAARPGAASRGLFDLNGETLAVTSVPVSSATEPDRVLGRLVLARRLDRGGETKRIAGLDVRILGLREARAAWAEPGVRVVRAVDGRLLVDRREPDRQVVHAVLDGIDARPAGSLAIALSRRFLHQGDTGKTWLAWSLALLGLVFGGTHWLVLDRWILARVRRLTDTIEAIGTDGDLEPLRRLEGRDELGALAGDLHDLSWLSRNAKSRALHSSRAKAEFLANMSHEIRTPMTAVLGFADADMSPGERQEAVHTIHRNGSHLLSILDDIVGMSEFAGELTISRGPCSPIGTVWEAVDMMRARAQTKGIELLATCAPEVPEAIVTDATRVRQVLLNLVGNAIKFTARGHVSIHVRPVVVDDAVVPGRIAFDIADSGIGMTAEQQRSVFRAFEQADASTSRRFGGTGLGLSICQRIAALLGGEIRMQSVMGEGSRFTFEIEARACEDALLEGPSSEGDSLAHLSAALAGVHVLVADPVGDASDLIETILRSCGALVAVAHDGRTVSERVMAAWRSPRPIDVVVIDMLAAEIDGCSTVRLLREAGYDRSIVGLSASTLAADRERCREAGCDAWVGKPFRCATLVRTVANAATRHSIERAAPLGQAATGAS